MADNPLDDIKDIGELFTPDVRENMRRIDKAIQIYERNIAKLKRAGFETEQFDKELLRLKDEYNKLDKLSKIP